MRRTGGGRGGKTKDCKCAKRCEIKGSILAMTTKGGKVNSRYINPIARVILQGLYDADSPLHLLAGLHYILKAIWHDVLTYHKSRIEKGSSLYPYFVKVKWGHFYSEVDSHSDWLVRFPEPNDININMMPFIMAKMFRDTKLPDYLRTYWDQILVQCVASSELGKICYLTIQESHVEKGTTQRTPRVHTESPGVVMYEGSDAIGVDVTSGHYAWGKGAFTTNMELQGGLYVVSNIANSCKVWNCKILPPEDNSPDIVGKHGDIEHLRPYLPSSCETMNANTMYWLTDRTPHESLPLEVGGYRQFVRVVTSQLTYWHEDHSTKNPLGIVPDSNITKIVKGSKFDGNCYVADPS